MLVDYNTLQNYSSGRFPHTGNNIVSYVSVFFPGRQLFAEVEISIEKDFGPNRIAIANKFKAYERDSHNVQILSPDNLIIRYDMRGGKAFTHHLEKPFDSNFATAMKLTQEKISLLYCPDISYSQSDEISLIFLKANDRVWNLRRDKILSVTASEVSVYFNLFFSNLSSPSQKNVKPAVFDCHIFNVPTKEDCFEYLRWRNYYDNQANVLQKVAREFYSHKYLLGKSTRRMLHLINNVTSIDNYPKENINGIIMKNDIGLKQGYNPIKNENVTVMRNVLTMDSFLITRNNTHDFLKDIFKNETVPS